MQHRDILKKFCGRKTLPVDVGEIEAAVRERVRIDQINYYPDPNMDPAVVRGVIDCYTAYEGTATQMEVADIYYPAGMDEGWQRLVQTKELVQLLDSSTGVANDRERIAKLISEIVMPPELSAMSSPAKEDRYALTWALAWLFPRACLDLLREPYAAGKITDPEIAVIAKIPARFIPFFFGEMFGKWLAALIDGKDEDEEEDGN